MVDHNKKITTIYVDPEIKRFCKVNKFNLSDWVNQEFTKEFLTINSKIQQAKELRDKADSLDNEVDDIKVKVNNILKSLTSEEISLIRNVPERLKRGFDLQSIMRSFNHGFNRDFSLNEFEMIVCKVEVGGL